MRLVARLAGALDVSLDEGEYIDEAIPGDLELDSNQSVTGDIDLTARFPAFAAGITKHDVVVSWSYQVKPIAGKPSEVLSGSLVVPKLVKSAREMDDRMAPGRESFRFGGTYRLS